MQDRVYLKPQGVDRNPTMLQRVKMPARDARETVIVGAGIAGLTLARCLASRQKPFRIFEAADSPARHSYSITLRRDTYQQLLDFIRVTEENFLQRVAAGRFYHVIEDIKVVPDIDQDRLSFRANRSKLERFLLEGVDVKCNEAIKDDSHCNIVLADAQSQDHPRFPPLIVGADGVHSALRSAKLPDCKPRILPYVVFNGKRRMPRSSFRMSLLQYFGEETTVQTLRGESLLRVSYWIDQDKPQQVDLSYTCSRPAHKQDPLHAPNRRYADAKDIPEALYDEIEALKPLREPFATVFDKETVRNDRKLHWLMRTVSLRRRDLMSLANQGIVLIGDAAHAEPILGGHGANSAILDGIALARWIMEHDDSSIEDFYRTKIDVWSRGVDENEARLEAMHKPSR